MIIKKRKSQSDIVAIGCVLVVNNKLHNSWSPSDNIVYIRTLNFSEAKGKVEQHVQVVCNHSSVEHVYYLYHLHAGVYHCH